MILVTGATGNVGSKLVRRLTDKNIAFKALTRDPVAAKSIFPDGTQIVKGDYTDLDSLKEATMGVEAVVLISPAHPNMVTHQTAIIDAAKANGVKDIIKLSVLGANLGAPIRLPKLHAEIESYAANKGLRVTAIRPNLFMQVLLGNQDSISSTGKIYAPASDGAISFTDVRDIADVFIGVIRNEALRGQIHEITGSEALTYAQIAKKIGKVARHNVEHVDVPEDTARQSMLSMGMDPWVVEAFLELFGIYRAGYGAVVHADNVAKITGSPARKFDQFAFDFKDKFALRV